MSKNALFRRVVLCAALVGVGVVLCLGVAGLWAATYPDNQDPKNIYYVLWKQGLNDNMNLDNGRQRSHYVMPSKQNEKLTPACPP